MIASIKITWQVFREDGTMAQEDSSYNTGLPYEQLVDLQAWLIGMQNGFNEKRREWGKAALAAKAEERGKSGTASSTPQGGKPG